MKHIFYVKSGIYQCAVLTENGSECLLAYFGKGSLYPVKCRQFDFTIEGGFSLRALTDLEVWQLNPEGLQALIRENAELAVKAIDFHTLYSNMLTARILMQHDESSESKVCNFLYMYMQYAPKHEKRLMITQEEVAAATSLSRIQVARVYRKLKEEGIIESLRGGVVICNTHKLRRHGSMMNCEY